MKNKLLKISLVGKTNAGKSTLINNLIGEDISVINKKINTTEDLILGAETGAGVPDVSAGDLTIEFPAAAASTAVIRIA